MDNLKVSVDTGNIDQFLSDIESKGYFSTLLEKHYTLGKPQYHQKKVETVSFFELYQTPIFTREQ